jgi:putative ABC transport system permease protein
MSPLYVAWKNAIAKPLRFAFNVLLVALATGLIVITMLINVQFKNHFERNLANVDLILSAKGSPLQSVLCNMFHIDVPTGNILLSEIKPFLNPNHPLIKQALPLSLGDQAQGFRIVGTTVSFFDWYSLKLETGALFAKDFEAVIGAEVANASKLKVGSVFTSGHGLVQDDILTNNHDDHQFTVAGILQKTESISDRLILVPISSYWALHHDHEEGDHHDHTHTSCIKNKDLMDTDGEITSLLLEFKGTNIQSLNFGRSINENTGLMAANPPIELNRMYELTGSATELLSFIAGILIVLASLSLFINLWQAMEERKYEIALLRLGGATSKKILYWVVLEAIILCGIGLVLGILAAHIFLAIFADAFNLQSKYGIHGFLFLKEEIWIFILGIAIGILSGLIPAFKSMKRDIHNTLTES